MKKIFILLFSLLSVVLSSNQYIYAQDSQLYKVLSVTPNCIYHQGKEIKAKSKLKLEGRLPLLPNRDYLEKNKLRIEKGGELVLMHNEKQYVIDYNDFINQSTRKTVSFNSNCATRGFNKRTYKGKTPKNRFHLLALLGKSKTISDKKTLKLYFNSNTYPINGIDTLILGENIQLQNLTFSFQDGTAPITFINHQNRLLIDHKKLPIQSSFTLTAQYKDLQQEIAKGKILNIRRIIHFAKTSGFSRREIFKGILKDYLFQMDDKNDLEKQIINQIVKSINETY